MEVSNPRDDRAERNRGSAEVPLSKVIPRVGNFHLEQNTILDSFSCTTTPKIWFISRFCVFFGALSLGENTWVRFNFITQAKSVAISVWCARKHITCTREHDGYSKDRTKNNKLNLKLSMTTKVHNVKCFNKTVIFFSSLCSKSVFNMSIIMSCKLIKKTSTGLCYQILRNTGPSFI